MSGRASEAMKNLIVQVQPVLRDLGFRKRGSTFNRIVEPDGLVHVVNFQRGGFVRMHAAGGFGVAAEPFGGFTVNLGVWLPGVRLSLLDPPEEITGKTVSAADCHLQVRLGQLLPEPADIWWPLDAASDDIAGVVGKALADYAVPWLGQFTAWDDMLSQFEGVPDSSAWFGPPPRLIAMEMRLTRGEHDRAERDFTEHLQYLIGLEPPELPGAREALAAHFDVLEKIAMAHHFSVEVRAYAAAASTGG